MLSVIRMQENSAQQTFYEWSVDSSRIQHDEEPLKDVLLALLTRNKTLEGLFSLKLTRTRQ